MPLHLPQTIQIYLPRGDPHGIRIADSATRIAEVIDVPRKLLKDFLAMPECKQLAVYLLFGSSEDRATDKVYVGQSAELATRLETHHQEQDFWQRALILIARAHSLTETHARYLEWLCIREASKARRYLPENDGNGSKPHTPVPQETECQAIFDAARMLFATLGYPVFDPVLSKEARADHRRYYCACGGSIAVGEYTEEGFVVLKGSRAREGVSAWRANQLYGRRRTELIEQGKLALRHGALVFLEDVLFSSPDGAAAVVVGDAANGWTEWKDKEKHTLAELERTKWTGAAHR
jgi:hypothetical protein